jgi:hypothetical protein
VREDLTSQKTIDYIAKMPCLAGKVLIFLAPEIVRFSTDCTATPLSHASKPPSIDMSTISLAVKAGRQWAAYTAEARELERLENFAEDTRQGQCQDWDANLVGEAIRPEEDDGYAIENFWEQALGDNTSAKDNPSFVKGFVEGALALWGEVKKQL